MISGAVLNGGAGGEAVVHAVVGPALLAPFAFEAAIWAWERGGMVSVSMGEIILPVPLVRERGDRMGSTEPSSSISP